MAVLTADHFIGKPQAFRQALAAALHVAQSDYLVTLGITPDSPSTEYGYIEQGEQLLKVDGFKVLKAKRFVENLILILPKPCLRRAITVGIVACLFGRLARS